MGKPSRKILRVNPSTMEQARITAHSQPAVLQRRSPEKNRYAASSNSTIISSAPNVIQWLMKPGNARPYVEIVKAHMLRLRLLVDSPELEEAAQGRERRDAGPQQNNGANLGKLAERAIHDQQNEEHIKFADLRHALLDVSGGQQGNHGSRQEKPQRKLDGRQP